MARNIFSLSFVLYPSDLDNMMGAYKLLSLLDVLRKEDDTFSRFKICQLHFKSVPIDIDKMGFDKSLNIMQETFNKFKNADIENYASTPPIEILKASGFLFLLEFLDINNKKFYISGNFTSSNFCNLSLENFHFENSDYDFNWYFNKVKIINQYLKPKYSGVKVILDQFIEMYYPLKIKYPLGWITYFSNESNIKMPTDAGFEVIQEENGQYVIVTRDDFTKSKESFFEIKDKLINGMKLLKENCPDYSEES